MMHMMGRIHKIERKFNAKARHFYSDRMMINISTLTESLCSLNIVIDLLIRSLFSL